MNSKRNHLHQLNPWSLSVRVSSRNKYSSLERVQFNLDLHQQLDLSYIRVHRRRLRSHRSSSRYHNQNWKRFKSNNQSDLFLAWRPHWCSFMILTPTSRFQVSVWSWTRNPPRRQLSIQLMRTEHVSWCCRTSWRVSWWSRMKDSSPSSRSMEQLNPRWTSTSWGSYRSRSSWNHPTPTPFRFWCRLMWRWCRSIWNSYPRTISSSMIMMVLWRTTTTKIQGAWRSPSIKLIVWYNIKSLLIREERSV